MCRDFAHLAITLCRCMNVPARYCTGYLGDIGVPPDPAPMDFSAWFEVYLGGRWYTFDARHNAPRIGRILMARGRDATDVAIIDVLRPLHAGGLQGGDAGGPGGKPGRSGLAVIVLYDRLRFGIRRTAGSGSALETQRRFRS